MNNKNIDNENLMDNNSFLEINSTPAKSNNFLKYFLAALTIFALGIYIGSTKNNNILNSSISEKILTEEQKEIENQQIVNKSETRDNIDFGKFWDIYDDINQKHIEKPLDKEKLLEGAIKGMVRGIGDPYTVYLSPEENKSSDSQLSGEYFGIGAELQMVENVIQVVSPLDDSPAEQSGLKPKDIIVSVDGEDVVGENLIEVVKKIKGPKGTSVTLGIIRNQNEAKDIIITRDQIKLTSVKWEMLEDNKVSYIKISRFGEKTLQEFQEAVYEVDKYSTNKIILDLRGNPGGYLQSSVDIAGEFIKKKNTTLVIQENSDGTTLEYQPTINSSILNKYELVILIDQGSASASEIVAGALRELKSAQLVGKKTFGKGTIQQPIDYLDNSGLNVTIGKWLTPNGYWVHENGIDPDFEIEYSDEDFDNEIDPQLNKALELLK